MNFVIASNSHSKLNNKAKIEVIGIREGEKIHEELVSYSEINNLLDLGKNYAIILCRNSQTRTGAEVSIKWKNKDLLNL